MGLKNSKTSRGSYDMAAVVSKKDKRQSGELPTSKPTVGDLRTEEENKKEISASEIMANETNANAEVEKLKKLQDPRIPDFVNKQNFRKMLLKIHPNITDIINFKAFPALAAGENYATLMLRIKMTAKYQNDTSQDFSFMLKVPHDTKEMQAMLQTLNFFQTENTVYLEVMPELEEMYRQVGVEVKFIAKSYRLDLDNNDIHYVLLEDLSVANFRNANRMESLNMEHTLSVLRKMAQFHAASACRVANKCPYPAVFSPDMDNEIVRGFLQQMFSSFKKPFMENLKTYENGDKYYDSMDHFFDNLIELFIRCRNLLPGYFNVLNHGDLWSNNILFQYTDDGQLKEIVFVDFQNTNWGSPALDLYYFILSSVQIDIKLSKFDYFISYYHEHLSENLKLLSYPLEIPSLRDFHVQMIDFGAMATITSFLTLGIVLLHPTESARFENFLGDSIESYNFKDSMYKNERYRKQINEILPWLHCRGFMEINLSDLDNKLAAADKVKLLENQQAINKIENIEKLSSIYPEWVNEDLFYDVLRTYCENFQKIVQFAISSATNAGDNYSSTLLKIDIDIELTDHTNRSLSYMLKIPPYGDKAKAVISLFDVFKKESIAYFEILSQLENIYREKAGLFVTFAPKCFKFNSNRGTDALLLENIRTKGFENCNRLKGLDKKHVEAVLEKMAQFHAASACLFESSETVPEIYKQPMYCEATRKEKENLGKPFMDTFLQCVKQYKGNEEYFSKVKYYADNALTLLINASAIDYNKFNVLNHGDCWTNNIMFQHDSEGNISNTCFVDFQLVQYGTPCYDLFYFLLSSPEIDIKLECFDYFVHYYYEHLKSNLELLKYNKPFPGLKDLHLDLLRSSVWSFYTVVCILSAVLLDPEDKPSLEKLIGDDEAGVSLKYQMFLNKNYRSHIELILPWLNRRGFLDFSC